MSTRNFICSILFFFSGALYAQDTTGASPFREHKQPPAEALEACSAAAEADTCSFTGKDGEIIEGTCVGPEGLPLACRPAGEGKRSGGRD